jgi:DNA-binding PadR family transcriptional regulator
MYARKVNSDQARNERVAPAQTELAILGALSVEPMTGYELRNNIQEVLGHFWSESYGQIYPTLARLGEEGLVKSAGDSSGKTHTITKAGVTRLRHLLRQPIKDRPPRSSMMLRLFFGRHLGIDECSAIVADARQNATDMLAKLAVIREELEANPTKDTPYFLLTIELGEQQALAMQRWADASVRRLRTMSEK